MIAVGTMPTTPVPPMRVHSRSGTPVHGSAWSEPMDADAAGPRPRLRSEGLGPDHADMPSDRPAGRISSMPSEPTNANAWAPPHARGPAAAQPGRKLDFSQNLQRWKALESPRVPDASPAHLQAPQPSPRRESLSFSSGRKARPQSTSAVSQDDGWTKRELALAVERARPGAGNSLPYAYDFAASAQQHGGRRRPAPLAAESQETRADTDAATALGNVWSGSSRTSATAGDAGAPQRRAVPMNMVGIFQEYSELQSSVPSSLSRATWSEGAGAAVGDSASVQQLSSLQSQISSLNGGPAPTVSGEIGPWHPAGRQTSDAFCLLEGLGASGDRRMMPQVTASTVCESPVPLIFKNSQARPKSSIFGVFTSKHEDGGSDGLDVFSMRRELLQSGDRSRAAKTKNFTSDLPHIGPSTHSLLSLPYNASSQLAAAAATAGDHSACKRNGGRSHRAETPSAPPSAAYEQDIIYRSSSADSMDQGQENVGAVKGPASASKVQEALKSDSQALTHEHVHVLEWFCTRKHKKYSLHRKSKLRLIVDGAGRLRLSRCSPMLNSIENTNAPDIQPLDGTPAGRGLRDSYGTPAGLRDSQGWISTAMQTLKRANSPSKTRPRGSDNSPLRLRPRAGDAAFSWQGMASAHDGFMSEDDECVVSSHANAGDKSPTKNGDAALRLGGRQIRHMIEIECVTFKEKHKDGTKKKVDDGALADGTLAGGSVPRSRSKDVKQDDMGKGTLVIKFRDGPLVRLSGMQVQDVAGDLQKHVSLWSERCQNQSLTLDRLVALAKTKVWWNKPVHREMLENLWEAVYPGTSMPEPSLNVNVSPGWKDVGFQSNDPCTDFRAMGLLGLHCLCYHGTKYPHRVRTIVHAGRPARDYPYAAVGINLVATLVQMLKLGQQVQPASGGQSHFQSTALFELFCKMPNDENMGSDKLAKNAPPSGIIGRQESIIKEHPHAFEEIFCAAFEMLDDMWVEEPPANILFFNTLLEQCRGLLAQLFEKRIAFSVAELRAAIRDHVPSAPSSNEMPLRANAQPSSNGATALPDPSTSASTLNTSISRSSTANDKSSLSTSYNLAAQKGDSLRVEGHESGEGAPTDDSRQVNVHRPEPAVEAGDVGRLSQSRPSDSARRVDAPAGDSNGPFDSDTTYSESAQMLWAPDISAPTSSEISSWAVKSGASSPHADAAGASQVKAVSGRKVGKQVEPHAGQTGGVDTPLQTIEAVHKDLDTEMLGDTESHRDAAASDVRQQAGTARLQQGLSLQSTSILLPQRNVVLGQTVSDDPVPDRQVAHAQAQGSAVSTGPGGLASRIDPPLVFSDAKTLNDSVSSVFDYPTARDYPTGTPTNAQAIVMTSMPLIHAVDVAPARNEDSTGAVRGHGGAPAVSLDLRSSASVPAPGGVATEQELPFRSAADSDEGIIPLVHALLMPTPE